MSRNADRSGSDDPTDDGVDRGQLLLVGAVSIALVFLGLVVVFNTVLFTDSTAPTEPLESAEEARSFEEEVRNDTRRIMFEVANETGSNEGSDFVDPASENITRYSVAMGTSYADTGPVYAAVEVIEVSGEGNLLNNACDGVTSPLTKLCAEITIVYETSEFTYRNTIVVAVEAP